MQVFFLQNVKTFRKKLQDYTMQRAGGLNLFPIIKKVTVSVPNSNFPKNIVLVDIPGHLDCNRIRKEIADKVQLA